MKKELLVKLDKKSGKMYHRTSVFTKGYEIVEQILFHLTQLVEMTNRLFPTQFTINQPIIKKSLYAF